MPHISGHIFNQKKLRSILKDKTVADLTDNITPDKVNEIVANWQSLIRKGILDRKNEIDVQDDFLHNFIGKILGYKRMTDNPEEWYCEREKTTIKDATRSDAALGFFGNQQKDDIRVAIELKPIKVHLDRKQPRGYTPVEQGYMYTGKFGEKCNWFIVSNYKEIRFYHSSSMNKYEAFTIEGLAKADDFELRKFLYLLSKNRLINKDGISEIDRLYRDNEADQEKIANVFYSKFKEVRYHLFEHLKAKNPAIDEYILLENTQKILDRFIFICFCEDTELLPARIFRKVIAAVKSNGLLVKISAWDQLKELFHSINEGNPSHEINRYDGGLFAFDELLDGSLVLDDEVINELAEITDYDFDSDLNVNILGHIFEQSISDIEEIKAAISGEDVDKKTGKRKKEGIYYTPEYITQYIVEQAVGGWLKDRRDELGFNELPVLTDKDYASVKHLKTRANIKYNKNIKKHIEFWEAYKKKLSNIKILDPACGSGAFLNQAFDYLYKEGQDVNQQIADLKKGQLDIFGLDKHILRHNLFGVDLNRESVEITKLSLWLKTADNQSELTALDGNILRGNSLVDNPEKAGDKAFNWQERFSEIMDTGGFDVVIGNPPYIKEHINRKAFDGVHDSPYYQGKMDIWTLFGCRAIDLLIDQGYTSFIAPNNWISNAGASIFRNKLLTSGEIQRYIDFGDYKVFPEAGIQTMIYIYKKREPRRFYLVDYIKVINNRASLDDVKAIVIGQEHKDAAKFNAKITPANLIDKTITFLDKTIDDITEKIAQKANFKIVSDEIGNGIDVLQDFVSERHLAKLYDKSIKKGDGIFVLKNIDIAKMTFNTKEKEYLKPYYDSSQINRYLALKDKSEHKIIYADKFFRSNIQLFPNLKKHIDKFIPVLTSAFAPYGLHRPREERFFTGNGIFSLRKTTRPAFSYVKFPCYTTRAFLIIKPKNIDYNYLTAILNSKLIFFWLKNKGKLQGNQLQIDKEPLLNLPIVNSDAKTSDLIKLSVKNSELNNALFLVVDKFVHFIEYSLRPAAVSKKLKEFYNLEFADFICELKKQNVNVTKKDEFEIIELFESERNKILQFQSEILLTENEIDKTVYNLYDLNKEEIIIVEAAVGDLEKNKASVEREAEVLDESGASDKIKCYYYFGYGSNMSHKQIKARCPNNRFIDKGKIENYKFVYDGVSKAWGKRSVANIIECDGDEVEGGIFELTAKDLKNLDEHEGYNAGIYDRRKLRIRANNGDEYDCYVYLRTAEKPGKPSDKYRQTVIQGAKDCGLEDEYVSKNL
jgi:gamma-glutamylcyclotransferase (GGCT)/AIG2-like uncharacterized protein YtfP